MPSRKILIIYMCTSHIISPNPKKKKSPKNGACRKPLMSSIQVAFSRNRQRLQINLFSQQKLGCKNTHCSCRTVLCLSHQNVGKGGFCVVFNLESRWFLPSILSLKEEQGERTILPRGSSSNQDHGNWSNHHPEREQENWSEKQPNIHNAFPFSFHKRKLKSKISASSGKNDN